MATHVSCPQNRAHEKHPYYKILQTRIKILLASSAMFCQELHIPSESVNQKIRNGYIFDILTYLEHYGYHCHSLWGHYQSKKLVYMTNILGGEKFHLQIWNQNITSPAQSLVNCDVFYLITKSYSQTPVDAWPLHFSRSKSKLKYDVTYVNVY